MAPKNRSKIIKKSEKSNRATAKPVKASAAKTNKEQLPPIGKTNKSNKNDNKTKSIPSVPEFQGDIVYSNMAIPTEAKSRKRSSGDSLLTAKDPVYRPSFAKKLRLTEEDPLKKAIEEIEMEGTSSETDYSGYYRQSVQESFILDAEKLLQSQALGDEESSLSFEDNNPEYLIQNELEEAPDFFGNFGDVPDVDEVSLDLTVDMVKETTHLVKQKGEQDIGKFVNPLTGKLVSSEESLKEPIEVKVNEIDKALAETGEEEDVKEEDRNDDQVSVDISIMSDQEMDVEVSTQKLVDEEDTFTQFLELEAKGAIEVVAEIDLEAMERDENERLLRLLITQFVHDLIDCVVERAEYVDPNVILRQNLDKRKLLMELQQKLAILEVERRGKQFLNRKCVEYFRRKRSYRPILEDNPKTLTLDFRKYKAALNSLDQWLIKEEQAKVLTQHNLQILRNEFEAAKDRLLDEISKLEETIRKTLDKREHFDKLQVVVANSLMKMNAVRKEIGKVRFQLIQKQHNVATLLEQLRDLEDLGNGLSMRNFETIQTETQALGKKIEERNSELNKLRYRCHGDIHRMAHQQEKQKMLRDTITFQRQYLEELLLEKQRLREFCFKLKIKRSQLRKEMHDISFQSGLLDKPILMKDYDTTVEYLAELRDRVDLSKETVNQLHKKISILENQCSLRNTSISL